MIKTRTFKGFTIMKLNVLLLSCLLSSIFIFTGLYGFDSQELIKHVASKSLSEDSKRTLHLQIMKEDHILRYDFLKRIQELFKPDLFIETGTYYGATTINASQVFNEIYTVELSDYLFEKNLTKFKAYPSIHAFRGRSEKFLENILATLKDKKMVFWLDAHYSGGETSFADKFTPIIEEISAIEKSGIKNSIILVDDIRYFYQEYAPYPPLVEIINLILEISDTYQFAVLGDTLIAYPSEENVTISPVVHACTLSRMFSEDPNLAIDIVTTEKNIANATGEELQEIERLYNQLSWEEASGVNRGTYHWWYGLTRLYKDNYEEGFNVLAAIFKGRLPIERLRAYSSHIFS